MPEDLAYGGPRMVVVGYDGSPACRNALAYAVGMARRDKSQVVIVEVLSSILDHATYMGTAATSPAVQVSMTGSLTSEITAYLDESLPGSWRISVRQGDAVTELEKVCDQVNCDAIVVGRCRSPARHPMGSVTGRLIRRARRPVIVVP
jgi:nucleotide-binding universal stress UspA family protein